MEVEVVVAVQEFGIESTKTMPYMSAPSRPRRYGSDPYEEDEYFVFDFSGHFEKGNPPPEPTTADELFEQGKIRPLKPLPHPCVPVANKGLAEGSNGRGRSRASSSLASPHSRSRKGSTSLPPLPGTHLQNPNSSQQPHHPATSSISCSCRGDGDGSRRRWIKDCFLFRSASEGRATGDRSKDPLRKFTSFASASTSPLLSPKHRDCFRGDESRSSSFRSVDSSGSLRRTGLSPHALHYTANRAAAEEMRKKTALPYRQGFFGWLQFSPALHGLSCRPSHR